MKNLLPNFKTETQPRHSLITRLDSDRASSTSGLTSIQEKSKQALENLKKWELNPRDKNQSAINARISKRWDIVKDFHQKKYEDIMEANPA